MVDQGQELCSSLCTTTLAHSLSSINCAKRGMRTRSGTVLADDFRTLTATQALIDLLPIQSPLYRIPSAWVLTRPETANDRHLRPEAAVPCRRKGLLQ